MTALRITNWFERVWTAIGQDDTASVSALNHELADWSESAEFAQRFEMFAARVFSSEAHRCSSALAEFMMMVDMAWHHLSQPARDRLLSVLETNFERVGNADALSRVVDFVTDWCHDERGLHFVAVQIRSKRAAARFYLPSGLLKLVKRTSSHEVQEQARRQLQSLCDDECEGIRNEALLCLRRVDAWICGQNDDLRHGSDEPE